MIERWWYLQDIGCNWPECNCEIPSTHWSEYLRKKYCKMNGQEHKRFLVGYDCSQINERLYIGAALYNDQCFEDVRNLGITHIIDAQTERNDSLYRPHNIEGLTILWDPTQDDGIHPKPVEWVERAVEFAIDALGHPGNVVLCHCAAGVNRGPSLGYAVLRCLGYSASDAENLIRQHRPIVQLAYKQDVEQRLEELGWTKSLKTAIQERYESLLNRVGVIHPTDFEK